MGRGLNKVMIIGHLGRDPEMRYTPSGRPVTSFSVATSRSWTSAEGERREEVEWFNVVAWGALAEICKSHLAKGQQDDRARRSPARIGLQSVRLDQYSRRRRGLRILVTSGRPWPDRQTDSG
jgi:primosomal replication protein N